MTPEALARLHASAFINSRHWSAAEFAELLAQPTNFLITSGCFGFGLGRLVAGEAELLTLAVTPSAQGRAIGRELLNGFEEKASELGANLGFLEVASDNIHALSLYHSADWQVSGQRQGYYKRPNGQTCDAVLFNKDLSVRGLGKLSPQA